MHFVTAFFAPTSLGYKHRPHDTYLQLFKQLHASLPWHLTIFTDRPDEVRSLVEGASNREIRAITLADLPFDKSALTHWKMYENGNPARDTPGYTIMQWSKAWMVCQAMELHPCAHQRYGWIDFGLGHCCDVTNAVWHRFRDENVPARITLCEISAASPKEAADPFELHRRWKRTIVGGLFTGGASAFWDLRELMFEEIRRYMELGVDCFSMDEAMLSSITAKHRALFCYYFGNYESALANYGGLEGQFYQEASGTWLAIENLVRCNNLELHGHAATIATSMIEARRRQKDNFSDEQYAKILLQASICLFYTDKASARNNAVLLKGAYKDPKYRPHLEANVDMLKQNLECVGVALDE